MLFNLGPSKQVIEICFSHKRFTFNDTTVKLAISQKHLGMILDSKLGIVQYKAALVITGVIKETSHDGL